MTIKTLFGSEEIRQFVYCPRILYFRRILRYKPNYPIKMSKGTHYHNQWSKKQEKGAQELPEEQKHTQNLPLENEQLGLCAVIDQIELLTYNQLPVKWQQNEQIIQAKKVEKKFCRITEVKNCKAFPTIQEHHKAQLVAQALLIENTLGHYVVAGRIRYRNNQEHTIQIWPGDKTWIKRLVIEMKKTIQEEIIPPPTNYEAKCTDCEYWNVCLRA